MNLVNPDEIIGDILRFKGFVKSPFTEKIKWLLVLYPFALIVIGFHLLLWIPELPSILLDKLRRKK